MMSLRSRRKSRKGGAKPEEEATQGHRARCRCGSYNLSRAPLRNAASRKALASLYDPYGMRDGEGEGAGVRTHLGHDIIVGAQREEVGRRCVEGKAVKQRRCE